MILLDAFLDEDEEYGMTFLKSLQLCSGSESEHVILDFLVALFERVGPGLRSDVLP